MIHAISEHNPNCRKQFCEWYLGRYEQKTQFEDFEQNEALTHYCYAMIIDFDGNIAKKRLERRVSTLPAFRI